MYAVGLQYPSSSLVQISCTQVVDLYVQSIMHKQIPVTKAE